MAEQPGPSEQDYLDAARASYLADWPNVPSRHDDGVWFAKHAGYPSLRAAVDSAFAAGWRARVPEGSEEQEEWGTRHLDIETCERLISFAPSRDAASASFDYLNEVWGHHAELIRRKVITTPWCPVEEEA